ncbi:MAG: tetratricopeptide repeat protein [Steroidobacteraceae bacterium]
MLLLTGMAAAAQVPNSGQNVPPSDKSPATSATPALPGEAPASPTALTQGVTITGKPLHPERPLPKLAPDEFAKCMRLEGGSYSQPQNYFEDTEWLERMISCSHEQGWQEHRVIAECLAPSDSRALPGIIQACTETLNRNLLQHEYRYYLLADRAQAYLAYGDPQHALADYNAAIKLEPSSAALYYDRAVVFAAQPDDHAALQDLNKAIALNSNFTPALRLRAKLNGAGPNSGGAPADVHALLLQAKIHSARHDYTDALADYSQAIRLQPRNAVLWSDRGYVCLRQHDYNGAIQNESAAIGLDPKLARAYFFRGAAFGELRDSHNAGSDINAALRLDPSLDGYLTAKVTGQSKNVSITLPLPP